MRIRRSIRPRLALTAALGLTGLLLAACAPQAPLPPQPTPTDLSGGVVLVTTPEAEAPSSAGGAPCADQFFPVGKGMYWEYEGNTSSGEFVRRGVIDAIADDSFLVQGSLERPDRDLDYIEAWQCTADGLIQLQSEGVFSAILRGPDDTVKITTISNEGITLPPAMDVSDEWDQTTALGVTAGPTATQVTLSHEFRVDAVEMIAVPAGTFEAYKVEVSSVMELPVGGDFEYESTQWFALGVGLIKFEGDVPEGDGLYAVDYQLVAYAVP